MISLRKLETLPPKLRLRKAITLIQEMEMVLAEGGSIDRSYLSGLFSMMMKERGLTSAIIADMNDGMTLLTAEPVPEKTDEPLLRICNNVRHGLQRHFGIESADWDFLDFRKGELKKDGRTVLPFRVICEDLRSPFNVGAVFRTAESFGVEKIYLTSMTPAPDNSRVRRTSMGCTDVIDWEKCDLEDCRDQKNIFVLETGGTPVQEFPFPREGTVIVGSEELGASPEALALAEKGAGRVTISTCGVKGSLNVSVAFGL